MSNDFIERRTLADRLEAKQEDITCSIGSETYPNLKQHSSLDNLPPSTLV